MGMIFWVSPSHGKSMCRTRKMYLGVWERLGCILGWIMIIRKSVSELVVASYRSRLSEDRPDKNQSYNGRTRVREARRTAWIPGNIFILSQVYSGFCPNSWPNPLIDNWKAFKVCVGMDARKAFQGLKKEMSTPPVLMLPDFVKPFIVSTDDSGWDLGAVLSQTDEQGNERTVSCASRAL